MSLENAGWQGQKKKCGSSHGRAGTLKHKGQMLSVSERLVAANIMRLSPCWRQMHLIKRHTKCFPDHSLKTRTRFQVFPKLHFSLGPRKEHTQTQNRRKNQPVLSFPSAKQFGTKQLFAVWCLAVLGLIFNKPC